MDIEGITKRFIEKASTPIMERITSEFGEEIKKQDGEIYIVIDHDEILIKSSSLTDELQKRISNYVNTHIKCT